MKFLIVLTYYRPHISGLTIYAELLAKALVKQGHQVTILTSRHDKNLPLNEIMDGVRVVRAPVLFKISKGVIMPTFGLLAAQLIREHDVVNIHLPQFDSAIAAIIGKLFKKISIVTYHCDLIMPPGMIPWLANMTVLFMNKITCVLADKIVTNTQDYAEHSDFLNHYLQKVHAISPPVNLEQVTEMEVKDFRNRTNQEENDPIIGMAVRFATEKGVEVVIDALPKVIQKFPNAQLQFMGPYKNIRGEEQYAGRLMPKIDRLINNGNWKFLGILSEKDKAAFFKCIDVVLLPSLNSTEAFGLVQIEAMVSGAPSIASDLPGVRQPVLRHGMGKIIPIGDSEALASALLEILSDPDKFQGDREEIQNTYHPNTIASAYVAVYDSLTNMP